METITPIDQSRQQQVIHETLRYVSLAESFYNRKFPEIAVTFDLSGRAAGMFKVADNHPVIRYNPWIFARYFEENFKNTIPHEVSHYLVYLMHGKGCRPHGQEWKQLMQVFKTEPSRTANYDLQGIPVRRHRLFRYRCECQFHNLGSRRHFRIKRQQVSYSCKRCGGQLFRVENQIA